MKNSPEGNEVDRCAGIRPPNPFLFPIVTYFRDQIDLGSLGLPPVPCGYLYSNEPKFSKLQIQFVVLATFPVFSSH